MGLAVALPLILGGASMALQYLFRPRIKQEPTDIGKNDDTRITGSEYGTTYPRGWGRFRVAGNIIFSDGITHTIINTPSGGGKGVPQAPSTRTHIYTTSLGVVVCRGPIDNFLRVWADADLILNGGEFSNGSFEAENATLAGGAASAADSTASGGFYVTPLGNGAKATFDFTSIPDPTRPRSNDPDELILPYTQVNFYYKCAATRNATITRTINGVSTAETVEFYQSTNWTPLTIDRLGFIDTLEFANAGAAAPDLDLITIEKYYFIDIIPEYKAPNFNTTGIINPNLDYPPNLDNPAEYYNYNPTADATGKVAITSAINSEAIRYYKGTETQTQDSAIIAWIEARYGAGEGILRTSAHRGLAWAMFEARTLKQGRVENYSFEMDAGNPDVNDVLADLMADVNISSGDYDFSATSALTQIGFLEHTKTSRRALIETLERYHSFRIAEIDGKIKTVLDSTTSIATIDADLLRAHDYADEIPAYDAEIIIKEENLMPREIRFSIMNPFSEYKNETVSAALFASLSSTESVDYAFPIIDDPANARTQAEKFLLKTHSEDKAFEFFGMPEMAQYSIGDIITVPIDGVDMVMRIEKKQKTLPLGKIRFQCISVSPFTPVYYQDDFTQLSAQASQQLAAFNFPRNSIVIPIQSQPLTKRETGKLGVYLAVCGRGRGASENIAVYREFDTDNYILQFAVDAPALAGLCEDTLGNWATPASEDTTNVLDIWFFDAIQLETVTQPDLDRFPTLNLLRVGDEWLQFRTATVQTLEENSPYRSKWRVTNLWRGQFGTTGEIGSHAAGEYAVLYTPAVKFFELDSSDIGETVTFKAVTGGQAEENGQIASFTFSPVSAYTVTNATADRTFDANATSINELADVLATVIDDLDL